MGEGQMAKKGKNKKPKNSEVSSPEENEKKVDAKFSKKIYEKELGRLQVELVKLQEWIKDQGLKVVIIFEGRDAAGKGGVIKRITESLNPRNVRVVALPAPTEREKTQWYFQRYVAHLPAADTVSYFHRINKKRLRRDYHSSFSSIIVSIL